MIKDMIAALEAGENPVLVVAKFQADFNHNITHRVVEPEVIKVDQKPYRYPVSRFHIKRDGRTLCQLKNTYGISWNQAIKKEDLNGCCVECQKVFYARLERTLTVV